MAICLILPASLIWAKAPRSAFTQTPAVCKPDYALEGTECHAVIPVQPRPCLMQAEITQWTRP